MRVAVLGLAVLGGCGPSASVPHDGVDQDGPFQGCAEATYDAVQEPASMLVVLDRSSSMAMQNKWTFAAQAVVQALDDDAFDSMTLGLYAAPSGTVTGPACIFNLPVACAVPPFPQVDLAPAGTDKSTAASGVRRDIRTWLTANVPDSGLGDASPMYSALQAAISTLQAWPEEGKRILMLVTDGTLSCNQFSSRAGYADCNGCDHDWENPQNIADLLATANGNASAPIESFVVGVPGADTYDATACEFPPYRMRLALSAIAYAGAPMYTPAGCDGTTFTQGGADPSMSCHFDMTQSFSTADLADAIRFVRGEVLGCTLPLPEPPVGQTIDPDEVNLEVTIDGMLRVIPRRSNPSDTCLTGVGCWDYDDDGNIVLVGVACSDLKEGNAVSAKVVVGCQTVVL
jgi:hypothetical protein